MFDEPDASFFFPGDADARCGIKGSRLPWSRPGIAYIGATIGGLIQQRCTLSVVLDTLCKLFDAAVAGYASSILVLDRTRTRVQTAVGPALPSDYIQLLEGRPVRCSTAQGAASRQMCEMLPAGTGHLGQEECNCLPSALARGPRPCWSMPIVALTGEMVGICAIYGRDVDKTASLPALVQHFIHIASATIERTRTEQARQRTEAMLAAAQQLSSTGSFSWRPATDEITWSEEVYRLFALDATLPPTLELVASRVHPDDRGLFDDMIDHARASSQFDCEHRLRMPDGSVRYLRVVARATRDEDGGLEYVGAIQDVTQRRICEATLDAVRSELARVARVTSLGALTASIAHEVAQPLSGIITNAATCLRMLTTEPPNLEGARETGRRAIRDARRAYDVITRLRALFTRKSARRVSVDLNVSVREVVTLLSSELQRARAILRIELAEHLPALAGDKVQLQQVIVNLLRNASEAMEYINDRPRHLVIKTHRENDNVVFAVQDSGVGLQAKDIGRLFDAFYTTKSDGIGIGLFVSRSIIEYHNGRLWAEPNDGPGATFLFSIPCDVGDPIASDNRVV